MGENLASKKSRETVQRQRLDIYEAGLADGIKQMAESEHQRLKDAVVVAAVTRHQYYEARAGQEPSVELADAEWKAVRDLLQFEKEQK